MKELLKKILPKNSVILEAGTANGNDTVEFGQMFPEGKIIAFEPVPHLYRAAKDKTLHLKNVALYQYALGEEKCKLPLYISTINNNVSDSSSLLEPKEHLIFHENVKFKDVIEVDVVNLDEFCIENGISKIDFMWLDMQGYEFKMLKSSPKILSTVTAIYTEVSLKEMYAGSELYKEYRTWLESQGFNVELEELPWEDMGNVLFVRK